MEIWWKVSTSRFGGAVTDIKQVDVERSTDKSVWVQKSYNKAGALTCADRHFGDDTYYPTEAKALSFVNLRMVQWKSRLDAQLSRYESMLAQIKSLEA